MDRAQLTRFIRDKALQVGFDRVGFAPAAPVPVERLEEWLGRGYQGKMSYLERNLEKRADPRRILEDARSVVSLLLLYHHPDEDPPSGASHGVVSRYARGDDYHELIHEMLAEVIESLQQVDPGCGARAYVDTGPVMEKYWAVQSGMGWLGKHTNVLSRDLGSWFFLAEILLDRHLQYDSPQPDFCGSCTRCIDACPTGAIVEPYVLDSRLCISYLTIELRDDIPVELRSPMGNLIFGCDICQEVCPWNRRAASSKSPRLAARLENRSPDLTRLAKLSPEEFSRRFRKSPVKRTKWSGFMRNVAVAMGNSCAPEMVEDLEGLLHCSEAMVRRHAAWALVEILGERAEQILRHRLERESEPETATVIGELLARIAHPGTSQMA